jgi:Rod binding domain-containing protein
MDISQITSTQPMLSGDEIVINRNNRNLEEVARDFEGVLIRQIIDKMKDTIPEDEEEGDASTAQIKGIFWSFLGDEIAENGGFGLWKDIYESMSSADDVGGPRQKLNEKA